MADEPYVSVIDEIKLANIPAPESIVQPPVDPGVTPEPEPEAKPEKKEQDEPEKAKGTRTPKSPQAQENFKTVTEARKAAEQRAADAEKKIADLEKAIQERDEQLKELPQTKESAAKLAAEIKAREDAIEELRQENASTREELKAASLQRTPEFINDFVKPIEFNIEQLKQLTSSPDELVRAVRDRNYEKIGEIREQLPLQAQYEMDAIMKQIREIELDRKRAEADADATWEKIQKSRAQREIKKLHEVLEERRVINAKIINDLRDNIPFVREDKDLQKDISDIAEAIAGGKGADKWSYETMTGQAIAAAVLKKVNAAQAKLVEEKSAKVSDLEKQLEEANKKIEDQDKFIKSKHGTVDFRQPAAPVERNGDIDPDKPIWQQISIAR